MGLWLGFPNDLIHIPFAVFLWPLALSYLGLNSSQASQAFRKGWLCTLIGMAAALYWLYLPVHNVGNLPLIAAFGCALLICACLALQGALFTLCAFYFKGLGLSSLAFVLALCWYVLEYFSALLAGFPWLPLCAALAPWPLLIQGASLIGAYLLGAVWLLGLWLIILPYFMKTLKSCRHNFVSLLCGMGIFLVLLSCGLVQLSKPTESEDKKSMIALFIEGNIDQNQKWEPVFQASTLEHYISLSEEALRTISEKDKKDLLLLWPETALPFFLENRPALVLQLRQFVKKASVPLLFGAPGLEEAKSLNESAVFNRAYLMNPNGHIEGYYDKEHLVPFGEYSPSWLKFDFLESLLQGVGIYEEGQDARPLRYGTLALGMLICYEGIFPWLAQERVAQGANLLVDISNDGWFGNSPAALQHLYLTVLRCVEQNRWLLRSTNTGLSAIADNYGRIKLQGESFKSGFLAGRALLIEEKSFYHRIAVFLPYTLLLVFIILLFFLRGKRFIN